MKKLFKCLFTMLIFSFLINTVSADTFTWVCEYKLGGVSFKYQVNNLDAEYIKSTQMLVKNSESLSKNVLFYYKYNGEYVNLPKGKSTNKFDGRQSGNLSNGVVGSNFIRASVNDNRVVCPTVYKTVADGMGGTSSNFIVTTTKEGCNDTVTGCVGGVGIVPNTPISPTGMNCRNNTTGETSSNCDSLISKDNLYNDKTKRECEYTINSNVSGGTRFKLIYDSTNDSLTYSDLGSGIGCSFSNMNKLKEDFKAAFQNDKCPSNIKCNYHLDNIITNKATIYIGPSSDSTYVDAKGETQTFPGRCGDNQNDNGEDKTKKPSNGNGQGGDPIEELNLPIETDPVTCENLLGPNLTKIVSAGVLILQIVAAVITVVLGMVKLIPAITAKDANGLKKASGELVKMFIILLVIFLLRFLIRFIGNLLGFDISCIV